MTLINYDRNMGFTEAVEAFAVILQLCLVKLQDEANFCDDAESGALNAAHFLLQMVEDAQQTVSDASSRLEMRLKQQGE
jgi:cell division protein ZapA (FtsZ GTPase activity inhibitor)